MRYQLLTLTNPKTLKGEDAGWLTAILHLAPHRLSGRNVCQYATPECIAGCLNTAGRGGMAVGSLEDIRAGVTLNSVQKGRIRRTHLFFDEPDMFFAQLIADITLHCAEARRRGLRPAVRLNGTSDIPWERVILPDVTGRQLTILDWFPYTQFYDYTKRPGRTAPGNYHLTYSLAETAQSEMFSLSELAHGRNVAVVFGVPKGKPLPASYLGYPVIDGDVNDLRFLDPKGVIVGLRAKGRAKTLPHGWVRRDVAEATA